MERYYNLEAKVKLFVVYLLFIVLSFSACGGASKSENKTIVYPDGASIDSEGKLNLTQFGITWRFDKEYICGQFVNGDYWVIGPVNITGINPESTDVSGRVMNGSMVNPLPGDKQGYDSACSPDDTFSASLNVGLGISSSQPLVLQNGTSLISSVSISTAGNRPQLKTAAVLTVLSSSPASGSFRPSYCGSDKTVRFTADQLDDNLLANLTPVGDTPSLTEMERKFERVWLDHVGGWVGRSVHPEDNMPNYGTTMATDISDGALMLNLNFSNEQKRTLLIRYVQIGIDNFGIIQSGGGNNWEPDGGHCAGRKWPILFAGLMLNNTDMKNIGQKSGDYLYTYNYPAFGPGNVPPDYIHFQEDDQTFYVTTKDVALNSAINVYHEITFYGHYYPPDEIDLPEYLSSEIGMPEWGIRHSTSPLWDGNAWEVTYRSLNAYAWSGFILSARIMDANTPELWNHPAIFDYQDRHMAVTATANLTPAWRYNTSSTYSGNTQFIQNIWATQEGSWRSTSKFMANMWDEYRDNY